ncbi:MAG: 6-pyruvoyl tetrahydrobiopterin synthase [Nitrospirae bacterium]|nr:MAG: 6-pyruvoyl tetrahydrobiopterin synthase [Nitrospirota bacterium]
MYELMVESTFSAAHQLRGYKGKCENLHGHTWRVQVHVSAQELNEIDLAIDFHDLKKIVSDVLAPFDHVCINNVFPFTERNPSSENLAKWIFDGVKKRLSGCPNVLASAVTVWESDTSSATYSED